MKQTLKWISSIAALISVLAGVWIVYEKWIRPRLVESECRYITCSETDDELY